MTDRPQLASPELVALRRQAMSNLSTDDASLDDVLAVPCQNFSVARTTERKPLMSESSNTGFDLPPNIKPGDRVGLENGTLYRVTASYALSPTVWVLEVDGLQQMIQCDPATRIRVARPA